MTTQFTSYKIFAPHWHPTDSYYLTKRQWQRVGAELAKSDLAAIENGDKIKWGTASYVWKEK